MTLPAALTAAGRGWHVFPVAPGSKAPAIEAWETSATTDEDRLTRWWTWPGHERHGVGIACGPSGLLVIDLDQPKPCQAVPDRLRHEPGVHDGGDVLAALCEDAGQPFPFETYTVRTGRGGHHLYFTQPTGIALRNTQGERGGLGWLIDTRGAGGYVVAAGVTIGRGRYDVVHDTTPAPLPAWLTERLTPRPAVPVKAGPVQLVTGHGSAYLDAAIRAELQHVTSAPSGEHNKALYVAAQNLGQLVAGGALTGTEVTDLLMGAERQLAATCTEPHPETRALKTIASGLRAGAKRPRKVAA